MTNTWEIGSFCIVFEYPIDHYKSLEEMLDAIYSFAIIKEIDDDEITVAYIDEEREQKLVFTDEKTDIDHIIPAVYYNESEEATIERFWKEVVL